MNRETKFRGKDKKTGEWVYGYLIYAEQEDIYYIGVTELMIPVSKETVGQFTGLKDKNGKEAYESDKILIKEWVDRGDGQFDDDVGEIVWENSAWFVLPQGEFLDFIGEIEVIGHIHE